MPNWCLNKLTVEHEDKAMIDKFEKAYRRDWTIETFLPTPRDPSDPTKLMGEGSSFSDKDDATNNWYLWRLQNWGTKWDIGCEAQNGAYGLEPTRNGNELSVSFDSAWSPPLGFYERLVTLGFDVQASYFEPGMCFCGTWENGSDNYYEGNWEDFPQELIDLYDIAEYNKELEEEV
tara:strand:+ start:804 stop:1331 length:528 start_codon:yes stop_codon:yes gene_type:complete